MRSDSYEFGADRWAGPDGLPDSLGRRSFFLFWHGYNHTQRCEAVRGQAFFATMEEYRRKAVARGGTFYLLPTADLAREAADRAFLEIHPQEEIA